MGVLNFVNHDGIANINNSCGIKYTFEKICTGLFFVKVGFPELSFSKSV